VKPYTEAVDSLLAFPRWLVGCPGRWQELALLSGRRHGATLLVRLEGIADRDAALARRGAEVAVLRSELPQANEGEFYWDDLVGLVVETPSGEPLGRVERLFATGANDVLVVRGERERLIPFIPGDVVTEVDLDAGRIRVDWDPEF
jgi:16S rRNA processing protein RimM